MELSTQILMLDSVKRGIKVEVLDRNENFISLSYMGKTKYVKQATKTSKDSYSTVLVMENKVVTKKVLEQAGIKVPMGAVYDKLEAAKKEYADKGIHIHTYVLDVTDEAAVEQAVALIEKEVNPIDILVNNAGITKDNLFFWMKDEEWDDVVNTNLNSMFRVTKAVVEKMILKKNCSIINMSSVSGIAGNTAQTNYAATKGGIIAFTKALALEMGRYKIRVNCVAPGLIESDMTEDLPLKEMKKSIPLRRIGKPEEVAEVVFFLADKATYITAETINISGGMVR